MKRLLSIFLLLTATILSQDYRLMNEIGEFSDATSFALSPQGYFYVADNGSDEIYKIDSLGNVVKSFGGYGWNSGQFDYPIDVSLNALNIFITDQNNHSIQRFDKDLNFISRLNTRDGDDKDAAFGFPLSADVSTMGDLFVLDSENKRILKFDLFGKYILQFGGYDAGEFAIKNPIKLLVTENSNILVLDGQNLIVFDLFGNGVSKITLPEKFTSIDKYYSTVTLTGDSTIYVSSFDSNRLSFAKQKLPLLPDGVVFTSSLATGDKIYALSNNTIYCFVLSEK
ncbi:MAG: NHL repeat-containing protein [Ignavibacteria bacterium]|nr:NHL repeat-containing protein [Ignavibacteria bacterium]